MAKAVGLDTGEYEVKVVELEGSYRRPRLSRVLVEPVAEGSARAEDESHAAREAEAALNALEGGGFARDHLRMAFPCREAVLRIMSVPFVGEDQIRKVIKFEAEGSIHSHNVDDMVVDFHSLAQGRKETRVLLAAVPKAPLRTSLVALEQAGIEPTVVDLDTMALFRTAEWCGAFAAVPPGEQPPDAALPVAAPPASLVLDLGARSTRVLVVVDGNLVDMRALRTGADTIAEEVATAAGIALAEGRLGAAESLRTDEDYVFALAEEPGQPDEAAPEVESPPAEDAPAPTGVPARIVHAVAVAARDRYLARLRRELVRFLTSVPSSGNLGSVWVTGGGSRIPGVRELLEEVFGVPPVELDVLGQLGHKLSDEEVAELSPKIAVAVGLALPALGGRRGFNFRQEELAFTKGFDRIKFPLAIVCMLGLFLVLVLALRSRRELSALERQYGAFYSAEETTRRGRTTRRVLFNGYLGTLVNSTPRRGWFATADWFEPREYDKLIDKLLATPVFKRLPVLRSAVERRFRELQQASGYYPELRLGSGLGALVELSEVLRQLESRLGRYMLTQLDLTLPDQDKARSMVFDVALRSDQLADFRTKGNALLTALRAECGKPGSAFLEVPSKDTREKFQFPAEGENGEGYVLSVKIELKPEGQYPVFPKT